MIKKIHPHRVRYKRYKSLICKKENLMDLQAAKLDVMQKIMNVSTESLIEKVGRLLEDEMIVGYTAKGEPLTKEEYNLRLESAEKQIASGHFIRQEDLEKEAENW